MIPFNAALVGAYWERLLVLRLEQRRVVGREPRSEQRSEGQPGYSGESLVHLHLHRAPISANQPTDIPATDIQATRSRATDTQAPRDTSPTPVLRAMDIRATRSPAMDIRATRETPLTPVLRAMDTQATQDSPPTPPRVTDRRATRGTPTPDPRPLRRQATQDSPLTPVLRAMVFRARRPILPTPVPVTEIPSPVIPAIALRRTGRLGPSTRSSLLAEFWPDTKSSPPLRLAGGTIAEQCPQCTA
jgi:hypothetical protein